MKKSVRILAAGAAAVTFITGSVFCTGASGMIREDNISLPAYEAGSSSSYAVTGGWSLSSSLSLRKNPDAKKAYIKATVGLTGVKYEPLALLGTQVVAGMNYCILCRATVVYPGAQPEIKLMYIYENLEGSAKITGFKTIIGEQMPGSFVANSGKVSIKNNEEAYKSYKSAMKGLTGVSYTPLAYLGSQVVAGTNRLFLCRSRVVVPGAPYKYSLVTIFQDLEGKSELLEVDDLELGYTDKEKSGSEDSSGMTSLANPWKEYDSVKKAADAAGVSFDAPETLSGGYSISYIQAMDGIAEVTYSKDGTDISVRKGTGTDDISGDYGVYEKTPTVTRNSVKITLRMNSQLVYSACWNDGTNSYAYYVRDGISRSTALKHISALINK